jgi:Tfp pilus assembly protein FimV
VAELEERRRGEVSELQRAQEALANTQVEATQTARRAKEAEARVREFEEAARVAAEAVREPTYQVAEVFAQPSITSRLAALRREPASEAETTEEAGAAPPEEELSLRERLARAAAARHRPSGTGES